MIIDTLWRRPGNIHEVPVRRNPHRQEWTGATIIGFVRLHKALIAHWNEVQRQRKQLATEGVLSSMPGFSVSLVTRSFASDSLLEQSKPLLSDHVSAEVSKLQNKLKYINYFEGKFIQYWCIRICVRHQKRFVLLRTSSAQMRANNARRVWGRKGLKFS